MVNKVPEWLATVTQVEFVIDEKAFITIASHALDFEGTFLSRHPSSGQITDAKIVARIKLGKVVGRGSLWDVYQAKMYLVTPANSDKDSINVMVKYTACMDFDGDRYFGGDTVNILDRKSALEAVKNDHDFYTKHFLEFQGDMIPKHYGTFIKPETLVCCMILEDVGKPIGNTTFLGFIDPQDK
ncbi:hypothetical protein I204_05602 [Kwoniella mangroviensis CBS 8886]|nr:hypothetical protein I204_05602 [Kwoniella mangroviensis CBS 8886]